MIRHGNTISSGEKKNNRHLVNDRALPPLIQREPVDENIFSGRVLDKSWTKS